MHIAQVIISGSANAAHLRDLNTPDAVWSGVWASDIVEYKLPTDPLDEVDIKRLYELQRTQDTKMTPSVTRNQDVPQD
jgi:DNA topoisomerase-6 subunit A